jgi:hypothetical protein
MGDWQDSLRHAWKVLKTGQSTTSPRSGESEVATTFGAREIGARTESGEKMPSLIRPSHSHKRTPAAAQVQSKSSAQSSAPSGSQKQLQSQKQLPDELSSSGAARISVGIDLGTSLTKICARERGKDPDEVVTFACTLPGEQSLLCPSSVALRRGRLFFGSRAEKAIDERDAQLFPHVKVCFICEAEGGGHKLPDCASCSNGSKCSGIFSLSAGGVKSLSASDLTICFLAWVMGSIENSLPAELRTDAANPRLTFNVGVPVRYLDDEPELRKAYWRVVSHAWRLARGMTQEIDVATVRSWIDQLDGQKLPTASDLPVQLKTEAEGAIVSWLMSPEFLPGPYCLIDIGAFTTDVSIFRKEEVQNVATLPTIAFLSADTYRLAVNDVDEQASRAHRELWPDDWTVDPPLDLRRIRANRESGDWVKKQFRVNNRPPRALSSSVLQFAREFVAIRLLFRFHETLVAGRGKHDIAEWGDFQIFVGGGGAKETGLWVEIPEESGEKVRRIDKAPSAGLAGHLSEETRARLLVAAGLAVPPEDWPELIRPSQVSIRSKMPKRRLPTFEELGYDK